MEKPGAFDRLPLKLRRWRSDLDGPDRKSGVAERISVRYLLLFGITFSVFGISGASVLTFGR